MTKPKTTRKQIEEANAKIKTLSMLERLEKGMRENGAIISSRSRDSTQTQLKIDADSVVMDDVVEIVETHAAELRAELQDAGIDPAPEEEEDEE